MPSRAVSQILQGREFLTSTRDKSAHAVAFHMRESKAGAVLVVDEQSGALLGICTERDLAFRVLAEGLDAKKTLVGDVMTADPVVVDPAKPFGHVLHMMSEGGFRHMPVVDAQRRPIGVVSARDALGLDILHFRSELELRENIAGIL